MTSGRRSRYNSVKPYSITIPITYANSDDEGENYTNAGIDTRNIIPSPTQDNPLQNFEFETVDMPDPPPRVTLQFKPATFHGSKTDRIEIFLRQFEITALANQWTVEEKFKILPCCLASIAATWYGMNTFATYDELKAGITKAFTKGGQKEALDYELLNRFQTDSESIEEYYYDVLDMCYQVDPNMGDETKVRHIIRGLRPSLIDKIIPFTLLTPSEVLEAVRKVELGRMMITQRIERALWLAPQADNVDTPQQMYGARASFVTKEQFVPHCMSPFQQQGSFPHQNHSQRRAEYFRNFRANTNDHFKGNNGNYPENNQNVNYCNENRYDQCHTY